MEAKNLSASVLIPSSKDNELIFEVISKALEQDYKNKEIILVWDAPHKKDFEGKLLRKFGKKIKFLKNPENLGLAGSLNRGIKNCQGEVVIVLLDDCVPISEDWLSKLMEPFSDERVVGVGSKVYEFPDRTWEEIPEIGKELFWSERDLAKTENRFGINIIGNDGTAYRKSALEKVGLHDSYHFRTAGEDIDISMKMESQGKIIPSVEAYIKHFHPMPKEEDVYWKWAQYAKSAGVLFRMYGFKVKRARGSIQRLLFPFWAIGKSLQKKKTDINKMKLILLYFKINWIYVVQFLEGFIKGRQ